VADKDKKKPTNSSAIIVKASDFRDNPDEGKIEGQKDMVYGRYRSIASVNRRGSYTGAPTSTSQQSTAMVPIYYDYRFSTPDKYYFPKDRFNANSTWRDIYRRDATIGIATDMYSELPWSDFDIEAVDDPKIQQCYEDMFTDLALAPQMPLFSKDFLIHGEFVGHSLFNETKGYWDRIISHNPDYVKVMGVGLASAQPLCWLRPTPDFVRLMNTPDPRVRKYLNTIPGEVLRSFKMGKEVYLEPMNTTYMPRKNTSQEVRGISVYTRLFRINMYEDFVMNASLSIAQRNAAPLRLFKMGDVSRPDGWMPGAEDIQAFTNLLATSETDPFAALITHPYITVDYVGVSDKVLLISREWEFIERVKLLAFGVSKAFLVGETSFASSVAGLQTLLERLANFRLMFEVNLMRDKLAKPVAEMNDFYEHSQAELDHRVRVKNKAERRLVLPTFKWKKSLEPTQDQSLMNTWRDYKERGLISDKTYLAGGGVDIEIERRNLIEEIEYKEKMIEEGKIQPPGMEGEEGMGGGLGGEEPGLPPPPGAHRMRGVHPNFPRRLPSMRHWAKKLMDDYTPGDELDSSRMSVDQAMDRFSKLSPRARKQLLHEIKNKVPSQEPYMLNGAVRTARKKPHE